MKNILVTGCAGFIGSTLVDKLLEQNYNVLGLDNLSTGRTEFIDSAKKNKNFKFYKVDLFKDKNFDDYFNGIDSVFHFAANADVREGLKYPTRDLDQNTIVTSKVLEAARKGNVKNIFFSSTGSIYGEADFIPTPENTSFPVQTSLYGASKLACEGLITAYSHGYGIKSYIFRFVSILGERYTHGHVYDFYSKLRKNPLTLEVLGNGKQQKSYLHINDCIDAILHVSQKFNELINIINLGVDDTCTVNDSISWITESLKIKPKIIYSGGKSGWVGDNPLIHLDTSLINNSGWFPKKSIKEGILETLSYLENNSWIFK